MVGWIGRRFRRSAHRRETGDETNHWGSVHRFRFVGRHPVGSWFRNGGLFHVLSLVGEKEVHGLRDIEHGGQHGGRKDLDFTPTAVQFMLNRLEFRPHLGHAFVVGEVVEHETQTIERSLATVEHMGVSG